MTIYKLRKDAAAALGVSPPAITNWMKLPGFPDCSSGYDVDKIQQWRDGHSRKGSESSDLIGKLNHGIKLEKLKEIQKKNQLLQMEIDAKNRLLLPADLIREVLMECAGMIRGIGRHLQQKGQDDAARMIEAAMERLRKIAHDRLNSEAKPESNSTREPEARV